MGLILLQNIKRKNGDPLETLNFFSKISLTMPKRIEMNPLVSPGFVCYAEKGSNFFRNLWNSFCLFVWIAKKH